MAWWSAVNSSGQWSKHSSPTLESWGRIQNLEKSNRSSPCVLVHPYLHIHLMYMSCILRQCHDLVEIVSGRDIGLFSTEGLPHTARIACVDVVVMMLPFELGVVCETTNICC